MFTRVHRAAMFALYQLSVAAGILLLPFALLARQVGVTLPMHRVVDRVGDAYDGDGRRTT